MTTPAPQASPTAPAADPSLPTADAAPTGLSSMDATDACRLSATDASRGSDEPPATRIEPGALFGGYRVEDRLGEGGMGTVWKALHVRLDKLVALKLLPHHLTRDPTLIARFDREMKAVGKLEHPHIVRAMDAGEVGGMHYLAMEYVEGIDLSKLVRAKGPRPIVEACEWIRQAALGLAHAHERGLVHRDVKPSNLLLTKQGAIKILDLGLARLHAAVDRGQPAPSDGLTLTGLGMCMGTPDFMSPEQWDNSHSVDGRADLYSLGCTLFYLLTGEAPYNDADHKSLSKKLHGHAHETIPDLKARRPDAPDAVVAVVQRLMAKNPDERFATGTDLAMAIPAILNDVQAGTARASDQRPGGPVPAPSTPESRAPLHEFTFADLAVSPPSLAGRRAPVTRALRAAGGRGGSRVATRTALAAGGLAALVLLGGIILKIRNKDGTQATIVLPDAESVEVVRDPPAVVPADAPTVQDQATRDARLAERDRHRTAALLAIQGNRLDEARNLVERVIALDIELFGPTHGDVLLSLNELAGIHFQTENVAGWRDARRRILDVTESRHGREDWRAADARRDLDDVAIWERLSFDDRKLLRATQTQGRRIGALERQGNTAEAKTTAIAVADAYARLLGADHHVTLAARHDVATLHRVSENLAVAESQFLKVIEARRRLLGNAHPHLARSLAGLADVFRAAGHYAKADPLYREAIRILERLEGAEDATLARTLHSHGDLLQHMADYDQAEAAHLKAIEIRTRLSGPDSLDVAGSSQHLAGLHMARLDPGRALPLLVASLKVLNDRLGPDHQRTLNGTDSLAHAYSLHGLFGLSEPLYRQVLERKRRLLGADHPSVASTLQSLAVELQRTRNLAEVESLYREALEIRRKTLDPDHPLVAVSLNCLGYHYRELGELKQADPYFREALAIERRRMSETASIQSERQQLAMQNYLRHTLDFVVSQAVDGVGSVDDVYREVLAAKGATLVRQRLIRSSAHDPDVAAAFAELRAVVLSYATHDRAIPDDPEKRAAWKTRWRELRDEKERLEARLADRNSDFRTAIRAPSPSAVLAALPDDVALVDYLEFVLHQPPGPDRPQWRREPRLAAFVLRKGRPSALLDLGPLSPVSRAVDEWRRDFGATEKSSSAGRELQRLVWTPLLGPLEGAGTIVVSTDGPLGRMPLIALPGRRNGGFLIEDHRIALMPVSQLLPELLAATPRTALPDRLLLAGNIDYDQAPLADSAVDPRIARHRGGADARGAVVFPRLQGTAMELGDIAASWTKATSNASGRLVTLTGPNATVLAFQEQASRCNVLHLATHGFFAPAQWKSALARDPRAEDPQRPAFGESIAMPLGHDPGLLSGLAFAGANRPPQPDRDDGILTADEIAFLPLVGVDLVTLSACETGLGELAGGEGLLGVQRAFQIAGARTTIASYWKVDDAVTRQLMVRFYRNLWERGMGKLDALREAQLWVLNNTDIVRGALRGVQFDNPQPVEIPKSSRTNPYYWAAFQLSGDWR